MIVEARVTGFDPPGSRGTAVVLRDLTETVETAESLALMSEQLAVVDAVLRHDVRNDVNVVLGWIERLRHGVATDEDREVVDRVLRYGSPVVELTDTAQALVDAVEEGWELDRRPVDVTVDTAAETVRIVVADNGPGIPGPRRDAVCETGENGPDSPGSGLGLYLVRSLVSAYGGAVSIADNEPRGTVVTVELERAD